MPIKWPVPRTNVFICKRYKIYGTIKERDFTKTYCVTLVSDKPFYQGKEKTEFISSLEKSILFMELSLNLQALERTRLVLTYLIGMILYGMI